MVTPSPVTRQEGGLTEGHAVNNSKAAVRESMFDCQVQGWNLVIVYGIDVISPALFGLVALEIPAALELLRTTSDHSDRSREFGNRNRQQAVHLQLSLLTKMFDYSAVRLTYFVTISHGARRT